MFFAVNVFGNAEAMRLNLFLKCSKFYLDSKNALKYHKKILFFRINAFELFAVNSLHYGDNTSHQQKMG